MNVTFVLDSTMKHVDAFEAIANAGDVFSNEACGKCGSDEVVYAVRTDGDDNKYYEKRCTSCGAKKPFNCHKKGGGLYFQKKKKGSDEYWDNNGWRKWNKDTQQEE